MVSIYEHGILNSMADLKQQKCGSTWSKEHRVLQKQFGIQQTKVTRGWGIWQAWERRGRCFSWKIGKREVTGDLGVDGRK
jgi:hypothetical protein